MTEQPAVTCGIDWAERHHDVALVDANGTLHMNSVGSGASTITVTATDMGGGTAQTTFTANGAPVASTITATGNTSLAATVGTLSLASRKAGEHSRAGLARDGHHRLQDLWCRAVLHSDRAQGRLDQPDDRRGEALGFLTLIDRLAVGGAAKTRLRCGRPLC